MEGEGRAGRGGGVMRVRLVIALSQPTHSANVVGAGPQDLRHLLLPNDLQRAQDSACQGQTDKRHTHHLALTHTGYTVPAAHRPCGTLNYSVSHHRE